ncbi:MAG: DUF3078 domain-containing protein [Calditrichaeota bacterium]|nr:DUF3078 domain-containing protein [Calditrichota bacterium]
MRKIQFFVLMTLLIVMHITEVFSSQPNSNDGLFYVALRHFTEIDSSLSEWRSLPAVVLDKQNQTEYRSGTWGGKNDLSGKFWIGWNSWGLALAAEVVDDSLSFPFTGRDVWRNDCFQFAIDVQDDNNADAYQNDDREFVATFADSEAVVYEFCYAKQRVSGYRNFPVSIVARGDTLRYEILIPWQALGMTEPAAGMHIGVSTVFFDNDGGDFRGWIEWTPGVTRKKFTLPFATVILFDPNVTFTQAIPTQTFLSTEDTLFVWAYCRYYRKNVEFMLSNASEVLFRKRVTLRRQRWTRLAIPPKFLNWGNLTLAVNSVKTSQQYQISVWSKEFIAEQIDYLSQQAAMMKNVKQIDPSASVTVENWIDLLQNQLKRAKTNFDFYQVMMAARRRVELIPNFYMKKQVYFDHENHILEKFYFSKYEQRYRRYFVFLPPDYDEHKTYPVYLFLHDRRDNAEEIARRMGEIFTQKDLAMIGIFIPEYSQTAVSFFQLHEILDCLHHAGDNFNTDKSRIFLAAEGSGAAAAMQLAKRNPDLFVALTLFVPEFQDERQLSNLALLPLWIDTTPAKKVKIAEQIEFLRKHGGKVSLREFENFPEQDFAPVFAGEYLHWLLQQRKNRKPRQITLEIQQLKPARYGWVEILGQENYGSVAFFRARVDSDKVMISTENLSQFALVPDLLPESLKFPARVFVDGRFEFELAGRKSGKSYFFWQANEWNKTETNSETLEKSPGCSGPMRAIFDKTVYFVYSSIGDDEKYNHYTYELARQSVRRGNSDFLKKMLLPDTLALKKTGDANFVIFGNYQSNAFLKQIQGKLPIQIHGPGLRLGKMFYYDQGGAALFIYPNPQSPANLILVCFARDTSGLENLEKVSDFQDANLIFDHDFVVIGNNVSQNDYSTWTDYGWFDHYWSLPFFKPPFKVGPRYWTRDITVGLDANQLAFNSNWKGGGKSNFTWKIYSRMNFLYKRKKYNWKNSLYLAFGQITVKEDEKWRSPEKSTDVIDFDSVLKLTLEKFIDPYVAFSASTQFHEGYDSKTKKIISRFANPLKMSQSAGVARNLIRKKKLKVTTRVGYASNEFFTTQRKFRKLWTGDESRGVKIDGGIEWLTEYHSEIKKGAVLDGKLKFFQAVISSITKEKDPNQNWRKLDIYWEQRLNVRLTQYVVFNAIVKFIYDRDTTPGGQFWENASFGLSYKF